MKNLVILVFIFLVIVVLFFIIRNKTKKEQFVGVPAILRTGRKTYEFRDLCVEKHLRLYKDCVDTSGGDPNNDCIAKVEPRVTACRYNEF